MTAPAATWTLLGITADRGSCDHCGRDLSRLFRVASPDGAVLVVGRRCAKNLTGYDWTVAWAERVEASRLRDERAAARYGALWDEARRIAAATAALPGVETAGIAGDALDGMRNALDEDWCSRVVDEAAAWLEARR